MIDQAAVLRSWMVDESFPFWAENGFHESGASWESLDFDGSPVRDDETRVRVQARQLYSFALAFNLGWNLQRAREIASGLLKVLVGACRRPDGLYGRRINLTKLCLSDDTADLYDTAFALLALVSARSVLGKEAVDMHISSLLESLDTHLLREPGAGYVEFLPVPQHRLQNPHMHLFESTLALYEVSGDPADRERVERLYTFIRRRFFDESQAIVREYADSANKGYTGSFEPGHSMEWVWLLGWRSRLLQEPLPEFAMDLFSRAVETLDDRSRACMSISSSDDLTDDSRRLWSQTETLKAHLCVMEHAKQSVAVAAGARAVQICRNILEDWLQPAVNGGWFDNFDESGRLVAKNMPASSGYHIYCAIAELLRITDGGSAAKPSGMIGE